MGVLNEFRACEAHGGGTRTGRVGAGQGDAVRYDGVEGGRVELDARRQLGDCSSGMEGGRRRERHENTWAGLLSAGGKVSLRATVICLQGRKVRGKAACHAAILN